jgi:hypothetical protein
MAQQQLIFVMLQWVHLMDILKHHLVNGIMPLVV